MATADFWRNAILPTRSTSETDLDQWNRQLRSSPVYLQFMQRSGLPTNGRVRLSRAQQSALERELASSGMALPNGMHIDQGGNLNQKNRLVRNVGIGTAVGGAALTGFGLAAAATTAATVPSVAPVASAGGLMSRIPWGSVASQGANTLFGIYANRQSTNANRDALAYQERANTEAMAFEREQMAESRRQFDAQQAAAERAHTAEEQFRGAQFASSEEERLYRRRLEDEREARRAPYRQASLEALGRLPGILASGRTSPGSLGSYRRS